ncbi:MAG: hypothetical protein ACFCU8_15325 [Thermosynechococcaceae cyanobacterium]
MANWLIYALGGGWGHLNRAIALGRRAAAHHQVKILTNSPYASWVQAQIKAGSFNSAEQPPPLSLHILSSTSTAEIRHQVQSLVLSTPFDRLIVDTFPRGLGGELVDCLPQLTVPKILVHRALIPAYIEAKELRPWVAQHYDLVLISGEPEDADLADLPLAKVTAPWLMWSYPELVALQNMPSTQPVVMVCAAGNPDELSFWGDLTLKLQVAFPSVTIRCLAFQQPPGCPVNCWVQHWPGMAILQQADVIVGGAGYNTVFEAAALKIPLVTFAFDRRYDNQRQRAMKWAYLVESVEEAIATLTILLQTHQRQQPQSYLNGVDQAVPLIEALHSTNA